MKFFLDENMPNSLLKTLKEEGHEVEHARKKFSGASDKNIVQYAKRNNFILITRDLEFGSLLIYPKESHFGLIITRLPYYSTAKQITEHVRQFLKSINPEELEGSITILELGKYRIRRL